jgi:hypothetical protein
MSCAVRQGVAILWKWDFESGASTNSATPALTIPDEHKLLVQGDVASITILKERHL